MAGSPRAGETDDLGPAGWLGRRAGGGTHGTGTGHTTGGRRAESGTAIALHLRYALGHQGWTTNQRPREQDNARRDECFLGRGGRAAAGQPEREARATKGARERQKERESDKRSARATKGARERERCQTNDAQAARYRDRVTRTASSWVSGRKRLEERRGLPILRQRALLRAGRSGGDVLSMHVGYWGKLLIRPPAQPIARLALLAQQADVHVMYVPSVAKPDRTQNPDANSASHGEERIVTLSVRAASAMTRTPAP